MNILQRNISFFLLLFLGIFLPVDEVMAKYNVGYRSLSVWNQKENMRIDVAIWYPTTRNPREFRLAEYVVFAAKDGAVLNVIDEEIAAPFYAERDSVREKAKKENKTQWEINQELRKVPLPHINYPLIVLSHDSGATRHSNHPIAMELVRQGFIVAMPMHIGDNAIQMPLLNSGRALINRARQISATLDLLLSHKVFSNYIDVGHMTFLGFGSGGTAGLLLTGTDFDMDLWKNYCSQENTAAENLSTPVLLDKNDINQTDEIDNSYGELFLDDILNGQAYEQNDLETQPKALATLDPLDFAFDPTNKDNPYCLEPLYSKMAVTINGLRDYFSYKRTTNFFYENISVVRKEIEKEAETIINKKLSDFKRINSGLYYDISSPPFILPYFPAFRFDKPLLDKRFERMIFVSPGYAALFDREKLALIDKPVLFVGLEEDKINYPQYQSEVFFSAMGEKYAKHELISGTDIWGLQALCHEEDALVEICQSVSDEDRIDLVEELTDIVLDFVPPFRGK